MSRVHTVGHCVQSFPDVGHIVRLSQEFASVGEGDVQCLGRKTVPAD